MENCQDPKLLQSHDNRNRNIFVDGRKTIFMNIPFGDWLEKQLRDRKMRPVDLVRLSGMDSGVVSNLINNRRNPGIESCKAIAQALKIPITEVLSAAGIIPEKPTSEQLTDAITNLLAQLDTPNKKDVLEYVKLRLELANNNETDKHNRNPKRVPKGLSPT
jgi:transcriptional regulator with XRE-family HTH domain